jgi:hypothetical protein
MSYTFEVNRKQFATRADAEKYAVGTGFTVDVIPVFPPGYSTVVQYGPEIVNDPNLSAIDRKVCGKGE